MTSKNAKEMKELAYQAMGVLGDLIEKRAELENIDVGDDETLKQLALLDGLKGATQAAETILQVIAAWASDVLEACYVE